MSATMSPRRYFRLDMRLREGGRYGRGTIKVTRSAKGRQRESCGPFVGGELRHEGGGSIEAHGVPQPGGESDPDELAVEVAVGIEQVRLDGATVVAEGRAPAEIEHPAKAPARRPDLDCVHTVRREQLA